MRYRKTIINICGERNEKEKCAGIKKKEKREKRKEKESEGDGEEERCKSRIRKRSWKTIR